MENDTADHDAVSGSFGSAGSTVLFMPFWPLVADINPAISYPGVHAELA